MTFSGVKMCIAVVAFMAFSLCSAKSVGFSSLASLAQVYTISDESEVCAYCHDLVKDMDKDEREHGLRPEYNTSEKLSKSFQETCRMVGQGTPDEQFCKALEGKFDVFTDAYFQHREHPEVDPCKVAGLCSAKSVRFKKLASLLKVGFSSLTNLAQFSAQSDETVACQFCNDFVQGCDTDGLKPEYNTSEKLSKGLQEICPQMPHGSPDEQFCKALEGKFDVFTDAYFQHMEHPEVDPCKVAQVCSAKSVGLKNVASFLTTRDCKECKVFVAYLDSVKLPQKMNTPEKLAKFLQEVCAHYEDPDECKKIKFDVFTKAYFQHREHPEVNPCKEAQIC